MTGGTDLLEQALDLSTQPRDHCVELAAKLAKLHARDSSMLKQFIAASNVSRRKAYYLVEIGEKILQLRLPRRRVEALGWTKLQVIGKKLTEETASELLRLAELHTVHQLKAIVREGRPPASTRSVLLYFSADQYAEFERAVLQYGAQVSGRGLMNKEEAIINMIRHRMVRSSPEGVPGDT